MSDRVPIAADPREHIRDELTARGMTLDDFPGVLITWYKSSEPMDALMAIQLSVRLGSSPAFWLNLDASFQRWKGTRDGE